MAPEIKRNIAGVLAEREQRPSPVRLERSGISISVHGMVGLPNSLILGLEILECGLKCVPESVHIGRVLRLNVMLPQTLLVT